MVSAGDGRDASTVVNLHEFSGDCACGARDEGDVECEVLDLPSLTSENEENCSGGETRTHNLAAAQDNHPEQHQLE
jgi:hypothetical protein